MSGPLEGIRVLDLSWILSGPFCTMLLCDLGAEVIKIEEPKTGDTARGNGPFVNGKSSYFISLNRGKKSVTLNLKTQRGKEILLEMVKSADVLVENFVPGTMKRLGLGYDTVKEINPRLIYASISGFGQTGPYAEKRALDIIIQAMGGLMSITGQPDGRPVKPGASLGDISAGMFTAIGILSAVIERQKSGQGQLVDVGMLDCQVSMLENAFSRYFATGDIPRPMGTRHPTYTPFQAFETADGYIVMAMSGGTRNQWQTFCAITGLLDYIDDERFQTGESRTEHYVELEPVLNRVMRGKTTDKWIKELTEIGIPCGPINNIKQTAEDPQILARNMITEVEQPGAGKVKMIDTPLKFSRTQGGIQGAAPELGQDTGVVLKEVLNMSDEEIDRLKNEGAI